jgi:Uma2 family endonuclease
LRVYRRNGVGEYLVWRTYSQQLDWFILNDGTYEPLAADQEGIFRSVQFPGLWLPGNELLSENLAAVLAVLQRGLATPEHQAFVDSLNASQP